MTVPTMHKLRPTTVLFLAVLPAIPLIAQDAVRPGQSPVLIAAAATTQPAGDGATDAQPSPSARPGRPPRLAERFGLGNDRAAEMPSEEEWGRIKAFIATNSPHRARAIERLPAEKSAPLRRAIAAQYRALMRLKGTDDTLFELRRKRLTLEDDAFYYKQQLNRPGADRKALADRLRDNYKQYKDYEFRERRHRIEKLEADLEQQKATLADDEKNVDKLVDDQLARTLNNNQPRPPKKEAATAESGAPSEPAPNPSLSAPAH